MMDEHYRRQFVYAYPGFVRNALELEFGAEFFPNR